MSIESLEHRQMLTGTIELVRSFETWAGGVIPSTDPADITFHAPSGHLFIADSEIDELPAYYQGKNVFETSLTGATLYNSIGTGNNEPTGITYNEYDGYFYITNDDALTLGRYNSSFQLLASVSTIGAEPTGDDPEGVTSDPVNGDLYVVHGITGERQVHVFNSSLQYQRKFSVAAQIADPEGIAFNPINRHLYLVSTPNMKVYEYTTLGVFVNDYSIAGFQPTPQTPQGLSFGPTSSTTDDPAELALYIADGGIDNVADGRIYEAVLVNQVPQVNAGSDQVIPQGQQATLAGTAIDDGLPTVPGSLTTFWQMVSGPGTVSFGNPAAATTTASFSQPGVYTLRLSADDGQLSASDDLTVQVISLVSSAEPLYFSVDVTTTLPGGVVIDDEDIAIYDGTNFSLWFDGSDVGLAARRMGAFSLIGPSEFLFTLTAATTIPGISGTVDDSDIVRFTGSQFGSTTSGTFSFYFDGSDVELTTSSERIDTVELLTDGSLVISTSGSAVVTGVSAADEDLLRFAPTLLGDTTAGTWQWYLDASDVGLGAEDVDALSFGVNGEIYLSVEDAFAVGGLSGNDEDVFVFRPQVIGGSTAGTFMSTLFLDGSDLGLAAADITAIDRLTQAGGGTNQPPIAVNDTFTINEDTNSTLQVLLPNGGAADSDPDGTLVPTSVAAVALPSFGLLTNNNDGTFHYVPNNNFSGSDSFTYTVRDNLGAISNSATVSITVTPINDPPTLSGIPNVTLVQEGSNSSIDLDTYYSDLETPSSNATFQIISSFPGVSPSIDPTTHVLTISGDVGFTGEGDITIRATDTGHGSSPPLFAEDTLHVVVNTGSSALTYYLSFASSATFGSLSVANEDIVTFDSVSQVFGLLFDGSDVGISSAAIDGLTVVNANEVLLSFTSDATVPGIADVVDDSDVVRFVATSWGSTTSGSFSLYFDGSDVGLVGDSADVDAVELLDDGRLVVSLTSSVVVGSLDTRDEDLLVFAPTSLGDNTSGTWDFYIDGSDLGASSYDVNAFSYESQSGTLLISFHETFLVGSTAGENEDILELFATQFGSSSAGTWGSIVFDGSNYGLSANDVMGLDVVPTSGGAAALRASSAIPKQQSLFGRVDPAVSPETAKPLARAPVNSTEPTRIMGSSPHSQGTSARWESALADRRRKYEGALSRIARLQVSAANSFRSFDDVYRRYHASLTDEAIRQLFDNS